MFFKTKSVFISTCTVCKAKKAASVRRCVAQLSSAASMATMDAAKGVDLADQWEENRRAFVDLLENLIQECYDEETILDTPEYMKMKKEVDDMESKFKLARDQRHGFMTLLESAQPSNCLGLLVVSKGVTAPAAIRLVDLARKHNFLITVMRSSGGTKDLNIRLDDSVLKDK